MGFNEKAVPVLKKLKTDIMVRTVILAIKAQPYIKSSTKALRNAYTSNVRPHVMTAKREIKSVHKKHVKPVLDSHVVPLYNKYGVKAKKMGKDAAYSIRMSLISGLELIS